MFEACCKKRQESDQLNYLGAKNKFVILTDPSVHVINSLFILVCLHLTHTISTERVLVRRLLV